MIIKGREFKLCSACGHKEMISDEEYGCDNCGKSINDDDSGESHNYLDATTHSTNGSSEHIHCCSWECMLNVLKRCETDYFICLPYLTYDEPRRELSVAGFWDAISHFCGGE